MRKYRTELAKYTDSFLGGQDDLTLCSATEDIMSAIQMMFLYSGSETVVKTMQTRIEHDES